MSTVDPKRKYLGRLSIVAVALLSFGWGLSTDMQDWSIKKAEAAGDFAPHCVTIEYSHKIAKRFRPDIHYHKVTNTCKSYQRAKVLFAGFFRDSDCKGLKPGYYFKAGSAGKVQKVVTC